MTNATQTPQEKMMFLGNLKKSLLDMAQSPQQMEGDAMEQGVAPQMPSIEEAMQMIQMLQQENEALKQQLAAGGTQPIVSNGGAPANATPQM